MAIRKLRSLNKSLITVAAIAFSLAANFVYSFCYLDRMEWIEANDRLRKTNRIKCQGDRDLTSDIA